MSEVTQAERGGLAQECALEEVPLLPPQPAVAIQRGQGDSVPALGQRRPQNHTCFLPSLYSPIREPEEEGSVGQMHSPVVC